jgi:phospholipid-binding lipoprotein MlaA
MVVSRLMAGVLIGAATGLCVSAGVAFSGGDSSSQEIQLPRLPPNLAQIPQPASPETSTLTIRAVAPPPEPPSAKNTMVSDGQSGKFGVEGYPKPSQAADARVAAPFAGNGPSSSDPLAPLNRKMVNLNAEVEDKAFHPVANGWATIVPKPARLCIHRFFDNVSFVPRFANAALQLKLKDAGGELARFGINSTFGVAGFFDPADRWFGIKEHDNDFDKTLAAWGMSGGWFVVMPIAGPINVRNALGHFVDGAMEPMNYLVPGSAEIYRTFAHSIEGLNEHAEDLDKFEGVPLRSDTLHPVVLESPDLYDKVRVNYLQKEEQKEGRSAPTIAAATAGAAVGGAAAGGRSQAAAAAVGTTASEAAKIGE